MRTYLEAAVFVKENKDHSDNNNHNNKNGGIEKRSKEALDARITRVL
jgi:hypothetical protein